MRFVFPTEMAVVKSKLESEGIECKILDEHTVQAHNFLSNAIGGIRLQVLTSEVEKAKEILVDSNLLKLEPGVEETNIEKILNSTRFQKRVKILLITLVSITLLTCLFYFSYSYINRPTQEDLLIGKNWCVDYFVYNNESYVTHTIEEPYFSSESITIQFNNLKNCEEKLEFFKEGALVFPGFNTRPIKGKWQIKEDFINVTNTDTLNYLLEGNYEYSLNQSELILRSDSITIYCVSKLDYYYE